MKVQLLVLLAILGVSLADETITDAPDPTTEEDNPWATYPSVAKTASINGFADRIYDDMPECAKPCMFADTGKTPCPYWDTGCLCIMPMFAGEIGECVADACKGGDVLTMRSLATSICSSAGVWDPYWMPPQAVSDALDSAASATDAEETPEPTPETTEPEPEPEPNTEETTAEPTQPATTDAPTTTSTSTTSVIRTASINGFADRIYDELPECAKPCMFADTGITPCPYWDTGCLCVMPMFAGEIGECVADACRGNDVLEMRSLATSACSVAGVGDPFWRPPASVSELLESAASATDVEETADPTTEETTEEPTQPPTTDAPTTTSTSTTSIIRTASINGFADRIYDELPECAKPCMFADTGITPCPYWDTGCLCVMPMFAGEIGECVADACRGNDVLEMRSLATSACSVAGVGDPFWRPPASVSELLESAASATDVEETADPTSEAPSSSVPEATSETQPPTTEAPEESDNPWATYPPVDKTASINGFADKIYDDMPECAKPCMFADTGKTPCPYWDTGCLCIMPMFAGDIGECVAEACKGADVLTMRSLATSICSSAGVWDPFWMPPDYVSDALDHAAAATDVEETSSNSEPTSSADPSEEDSSSDPAPTESVDPSDESSSVIASTESSIESSVDPADPAESSEDPTLVDPETSIILTTTTNVVTETSTTCEESFTYTNQTSTKQSSNVTTKKPIETDIETETIDVIITKTKTLCTKCKTVTKTENGVPTTVLEDEEEITKETESPKSKQQTEGGEVKPTKSGEVEAPAKSKSGEAAGVPEKETKPEAEVAPTAAVSSSSAGVAAPQETGIIDQINSGSSLMPSIVNFVIIAMSLVYFL
ncbi:hypothetical protein DFJ63DRAFT_336159 [Scheffersomyces coipomensis]|uniref:uncharacterized protein n=1 Tax=Scheffersomyces coipomensis TaxID=1788519 RepID=UPI00315DBE21